MTTQKPDTLERGLQAVITRLSRLDLSSFYRLGAFEISNVIEDTIESLTALQSRDREVREPVAYAVLERENGSPVALCYSQDDASDWVVSSSSQYRNQNISAPRYQVIALTAALKESL